VFAASTANLHSSNGKSAFFVPLTNIFQALAVRDIRNETRNFMTNSQNEISFFQQIRWFFKYYLPSKEQTIFLILDPESYLPMGYLGLREKGKELLITEAFKESSRGKGFGSLCLDFLLTKYTPAKNKTIVAEILEDNLPSQKLHQKFGFEACPELTELRTLNNKPSKVLFYHLQCR
jgi:ribosomal protein S18 acetylase RimI-like enzyme